MISPPICQIQIDAEDSNDEDYEEPFIKAPQFQAGRETWYGINYYKNLNKVDTDNPKVHSYLKQISGTWFNPTVDNILDDATNKGKNP